MFTARHIDGPMNGIESAIAAPRVPRRLFYAPAPAEVDAGFLSAGYMLVGYDSEPEQPWEGQVVYLLDEVASELRPHVQYASMREGTAVYVLAP